MSYNSTQRQAGSTDSNQQAANDQRRTDCHYRRYTRDDFAEQDEVTQFNGIRIVDASGESEEFESFSELSSSQWTINCASGVRLSDGTLLYEVHQ